MNNRQALEELQKYVPEGYLAGCTHIPQSGCGQQYVDLDGNAYQDWSSGIFTNSFGHGGLAMPEGWNRLSNIHGRHSMEELAFWKALFAHLPRQDYRGVAYGDGGGYTIDRGLTVLHQYFGKRNDLRIAAYITGFHGKTQATKLLINRTQAASFFQNYQLPFPNCYRCPWGREPNGCARECIAGSCRFLEENRIDVLVFEPVQGAGIIPAPEGYWPAVGAFCRRRGILLFADEVLTGGGRTGSYLASAAFGLEPDLIALTKGLANGLPLSVLLMRDYITQNPYSARPLEYSSTFLAVPPLLTVGCAVLNALKEQDILSHVKAMGKLLGEGLNALKERFDCIGDVRQIGLMAAIEFVADRQSKQPDPAMGERVYLQCERCGLELIDSGHIVRIAPPLNASAESIRIGLLRLERGIERATREG